MEICGMIADVMKDGWGGLSLMDEFFFIKSNIKKIEFHFFLYTLLVISSKKKIIFFITNMKKSCVSIEIEKAFDFQKRIPLKRDIALNKLGYDANELILDWIYPGDLGASAMSTESSNKKRNRRDCKMIERKEPQ